MRLHFPLHRSGQLDRPDCKAKRPVRLLCASAGFVLAAMLAGGTLASQVITIDTNGKGGVASNGPVEHQYQQIVPTHVDLPKQELDAKTRLLLIRALMSEQGFAMRPFPRGHKGLLLAANGKLEPAGESYLNMVVDQGLSAKPGQRVVITNIRVDKSRIIFDLDGGPDAKHRFLRHIQIGMGGPMDDPDMDPTMLDQSGDPAGARLTLAFGNYVPEVTPEQVKALLAPLVSFDVKTPVQAFTDTLPEPLKEAILNHKVWVGMSTDMVLFAKGRPRVKSREMEGQMPVEIWIYGTPPEEVTFVRINGNRVIKVEIAKPGEPMEVYDKDVVSPIMMASGSPQIASSNTRVVHEGDVQTDPDKQAPAAPPSLRNPGEQLPTDTQSTGVMRPVQFPKQHPDDTPGANPDEQQSGSPANSQPAPATPSSGAPAPPASQPSNGQPSQPQPQPASGSHPQSNPNQLVSQSERSQP
jgi:hypothetical protein